MACIEKCLLVYSFFTSVKVNFEYKDHVNKWLSVFENIDTTACNVDADIKEVFIFISCANCLITFD